MRALTMKLRLLSIGAATGLTLGVVGTAAAVAGNPPPTPYKACANAKSVLTLEVNGACPSGSVLVSLGAKGATGVAGKLGKQGATGPQGPQGPPGSKGTDGADGASVDTSPAVPSGFCTEGDSDIDLANGEVYSCMAYFWEDSGQSIMGPAGASVVTSAGAPNGACGSDDSDIDVSSGEVYFCHSSAWEDSGKSLMGPAGANGTNGTNGTNGASVVTSAGAPSGTCTSGDSDIDVSSGEVYSCHSSTWLDSGHSLIGPAGTNGSNGTNGTNGASVTTSSGAPSGTCTSGDSDIDVSSGEVYSCHSSTWLDSGESLAGPAGAPGTNGVSVTTVQLDPGDPHCPYGGGALTAANGTTYVCDGEPAVEDVTWSPTLENGSASSTTQIEAGSTLQSVEASLTGDLSSCAGGFSVAVSTNGIAGDLATWTEGSGSDYSVPLDATSDIGSSFTETGTYPLSAVATCDDGGGNPISWPSGVQIVVTLQWTHAVAARTIS